MADYLESIIEIESKPGILNRFIPNKHIDHSSVD